MRLLRRPLAALLLPLLLLLPSGAAPLGAQCARCDALEEGRGIRWGGEGVTLAANAALGGVTAGLLRRARGGSFREGFLSGAAGGAATYAGKRLVAERWGGAGMLGRQVGAVGSSVSRNAALGKAALDEVMLPLGPLRVYVRAREERPVHLKLDLASTAVAAYVALREDTELDGRESLSSGVLVFRRYGDPEEIGWNGAQVAGVVQVRAGASPEAPLALEEMERIRGTLAHERVHVVQYDQSFLLWSAPAEAWALRGAGWSRAVHRYVDLGLNAPLWAGLNSVFPYDSRPWEEEAYFLSRTRPEEHAAGAAH